MANHALPTLTSTYTNFLTEMGSRIDDAVKQGRSDAVTLTNPPVGAIRWNATSKIWEQNTGTVATPAWTALATAYGISITGDAGSVDGKSFGAFTAAGGILYATSTTAAAATAAGTSGQVLLSGAAGAPTWANQSTLAVGSATNLAGGVAGAVHYQSGAGASGFTAAGTTGQVLTSAGAAAPTWTAQSSLAVGSATTATNLAGGGAGTIPYQSAAGTTGQLAAGTSGFVLRSNGAAAPSWVELDMTYLPGAAFKKSVRVATTANITLSGTQTIDGIAVVAGDRVLVKDQTTASQNGIYVVSAGAWTRATDADTSAEIGAGFVAIDLGTANGGELWTTNFKATDTLGTTSMSWFELLYNSGTWAINTTGSAATLTTARTLTIGATGKTFNGSANVSWTVAEIGAVARTSATGSAGTPAGTTAQRDASPAAGYFRFNTTLGKFEGYNGTGWGAVGGGATGGGSDDIFVENGQTVTTNYTITSGKNAMSAGPITIANGITVTIPTGSVWTIV